MLSLLLSLCVCSVSAVYDSQVYHDGYLITPDSNINTFAPAAPLATSILPDWFNSGPYATDFRLPAGNDSVVVDVISNNGRYARRYVFPQGSWAGVYINSSANVTFAWTTENPKDCLYMYTAYDYSSGTFDVNSYTVIYPTEAASGKYIGSVLYGAGGAVTLGGLVTNGLIEFENSSVSSLGKSLAFPDGVILEEKKTQGMISQLISDIKDWFSNLIESMGNFFTELANKISGFFTQLGDRIKGFFTQLVEDIKGLFVPSDGFFDEYSDNFEAWAREHFGFLFETLEIVDTAINKYVSFSPSDDFVVTLPEASFTVKDKNYILWEQQTFSVNSLLTSIPALSMFHTVYFTFVYALFFYLLYRLGEKAYTDIFGGSD